MSSTSAVICGLTGFSYGVAGVPLNRNTDPRAGNPRGLLGSLGILPVKLVILACHGMRSTRIGFDERISSAGRAIDESPVDTGSCGNGELAIRIARIVEHVEVINSAG